MKKINDLILEGAEDKVQSTIGKQIYKVFNTHRNKLMEMIETREANWDKNKFEWSREPMFLIADPSSQLTSKDHPRGFAWVRMKFLKGHKDDIKGSFKTYNIADGSGNKPNSAIGIYYDRKFQFITSKAMFDELYDILNK